MPCSVRLGARVGDQCVLELQKARRVSELSRSDAGERMTSGESWVKGLDSTSGCPHGGSSGALRGVR